MRLFMLLGLAGGLVFMFFCFTWVDVLGVLFFLGFSLFALLGILYRNPAGKYVTSVEPDEERRGVVSR